MKTTRRKWLAGIAGLFAAPLAAQVIERDEIHRAGDPGSEDLEVYHADTGAVMDLVQTVCVGKWIDQVVRRDGRLIEFDIRGNPEVARIPGPWLVRKKKSGDQLTVEWKRAIRRMIEERRHDRAAVHSMPFPVVTPNIEKSWAPTSR